MLEFILFMLAILYGMLTFFILNPKCTFHGPDSNIEVQKIHYHRPSNQCYSFIVQPTKCKKKSNH